MTRVGVKILLTSGRTLLQGKALEMGKTTPEYYKNVAYCEIDQTAADVLGVSSGDLVEIDALYGNIIVPCRITRDGEPGIAFMPTGPFYNALMGGYTQETGMPQFKEIEAQLFKAIDAVPTTIDDLIPK